MAVQIESVTNRLACNITSRVGLLDVLSGETIRIFKGVEARIECGLFNGVPSSSTFVTDTGNITQADLYIRKTGPNGSVLLHKTLLDAAIVNISYGSWADGSAEQLTFVLDTTDTNQLVPSDGTLKLYYTITFTTSAGKDAVFGNGELRDVGLTNLVVPLPEGVYFNLYVDANGLVQNSAVNFANTTVTGLSNNLAVYFVGLTYRLTSTFAAAHITGLVLNKAGTYLLMPQITILKTDRSTADYTFSAKLRRTNNTAADITNTLSTFTDYTYSVEAMENDTYHVVSLPAVYYTTTGTTDNLVIYAKAISTGDVACLSITEVSIVALKT